ncbi:deaminase domain-containing protein [Wukongibacter baidiensis]|uniref:deaminase domain-containing protein n=1 Tax=Wukongibacter baidiensis TaxID=1723361 RepID=UPI003D7F2102
MSEPKKEDRIFETLKVNKDNIIDGDNASGKIKLYTDLNCCPSCQRVIEQFKKRCPNNDIEIVYKTKGGRN